jgi:DNA-binding response OmpR family regulator
LINNSPINLTSKEFDLLVYFIANKNRVIQKKCTGTPVGDSADQFDNFFHLQSRKKS